MAGAAPAEAWTGWDGTDSVAEYVKGRSHCGAALALIYPLCATAGPRVPRCPAEWYQDPTQPLDRPVWPCGGSAQTSPTARAADGPGGRFFCGIKRWLHRSSHRPAMRAGRDEKREFSGSFCNVKEKYRGSLFGPLAPYVAPEVRRFPPLSQSIWLGSGSLGRKRC